MSKPYFLFEKRTLNQLLEKYPTRILPKMQRYIQVTLILMAILICMAYAILKVFQKKIKTVSIPFSHIYIYIYIYIHVQLFTLIYFLTISTFLVFLRWGQRSSAFLAQITVTGRRSQSSSSSSPPLFRTKATHTHMPYLDLPTEANPDPELKQAAPYSDPQMPKVLNNIYKYIYI